MNKVFVDNIDWKRVGKGPDDLQCEILDAILSEHTGLLELKVSLDFVLPQEAEEQIADRLSVEIPGVSRVRMHFVREDLAIEETIAVALETERVLRRHNGYYFGRIDPGKVVVEGEQVTIFTVGQTMSETLNHSAARFVDEGLSGLLKRPIRVMFRNDAEQYDLVEKELENRIIAEQAAAPKPAAGDAPKPRSSAPAGKPVGTPKRNRRRRGGLGNKVTGNSVPLASLSPESGDVVVEGMIFHREEKPIRDDRLVVSLVITDKASSARLKFFIENEKWAEIGDTYKEGTYVAAEGTTELNRFDNLLDVMIRNIEVRQAPRREDHYQGIHRVELHAHTIMSDMDGMNDPVQMVNTAADWGQPAVAITDHGVVQSFPDAFGAGQKRGIKVILGMEGYVFEDRDRIQEDGSIDYKGTRKDPVKTNHIILLAASQEGLKNLYKLVSISHLHYFYRRPRLPKSVIRQYREGIIIGSACEAGEVYRAVRENRPQEEIDEIASFYDYLEIQPLINNRFMIENERYPEVNSWDDLRELNRRIIALADRLGKPVVATTDAHYNEPESAIFRNIIMMGKGFKDAENGEGLYLRTTEEMMEEFAYLGEEDAYRVVVENPNKIADMIDDVRPVPKEKCPPKIEGAEETLRVTCMERAHEIYGDPLPEIIQTRLDTELNAIISNGYAVMYVSAQMLVRKSNEDGYLVGSRGSVGSSFAATMAGITEVNPLDPHYICPNCKHLEWGDMNLYDCGIDMPEKACPQCGTMMHRDGFTIPFATFLGFEGNKEPDIDLNFAGEYQARAHKYVGVIFGEKNVYKAGTVSAIQEKTAKGFVRKFAEETGRSINEFELKRLAIGCTGVKRTTGQHPGGIVIVPDDREIYEFCPIQRPANDTSSDIITTHFDYHKIDSNLLKLDILGHNIPSMIRHLQDMTGVDPMELDLSDRTVLSIFNGTEALKIQDPDYQFTHGSYGIPEFGTSFVRGMLDDVKPDKFADLVRMSGFSHGTAVWLGNAQDYIREGVATMREVISTRDDIMNYLILKGLENEKAFQIMEDVRKKNRVLKEEDKELMREHDVPQWYIDSCGKIEYMFPRAHAVAYVMMSFRLAWYKVYYPAEFYAATFTNAADDFDVATILAGSAAILSKLEEYSHLEKNERKKKEGQITVLELVYEMYARGFTFRDAELGLSDALRFKVVDGQLVLPYVAFPGVGASAAEALADAYAEKPFGTVEEARSRSKVSKSVIETLREHGVFDGMPETDQLTFAI